MTAEIVERVLRSARYHDVDRALLGRLAAEELPRSRNADDAVKRVKRRLHQAVGAFRGAGSTRALDAVRKAWTGDLDAPVFRAACTAAMRRHASTSERVPYLDALYGPIWALTGGSPQTLLDVGCGLGPLALPWMGLAPDARYLAVDVDRRVLAAVEGFLQLVGQPHRVEARDAVTAPPSDAVDVALLLKLVTTLDRQDPSAAARLLRGLNARHAVLSFTSRSLSGRSTGMERTYRQRLDRLAEAGRVTAVAEASVPNELVFVLTLDHGRG
jgi:16S rRNA (guanine(1405)-N(7))-methyltransferase